MINKILCFFGLHNYAIRPTFEELWYQKLLTGKREEIRLQCKHCGATRK